MEHTPAILVHGWCAPRSSLGTMQSPVPTVRDNAALVFYHSTPSLVVVKMGVALGFASVLLLGPGINH